MVIGMSHSRRDLQKYTILCCCDDLGVLLYTVDHGNCTGVLAIHKWGPLGWCSHFDGGTCCCIFFWSAPILLFSIPLVLLAWHHRSIHWCKQDSMDCSYDYCLISVEIQLREVQVHCFLHITVRGYINQCFLSYDHFWHSFYCTYYMMGLVVFSACYQYLSLSYCCCLHGHSCITASQCDNCLTISYL